MVTHIIVQLMVWLVGWVPIGYRGRCCDLRTGIFTKLRNLVNTVSFKVLFIN